MEFIPVINSDPKQSADRISSQEIQRNTTDGTGIMAAWTNEDTWNQTRHWHNSARCIILAGKCLHPRYLIHHVTIN